MLSQEGGKREMKTVQKPGVVGHKKGESGGGGSRSCQAAAPFAPQIVPEPPYHALHAQFIPHSLPYYPYHHERMAKVPIWKGSPFLPVRGVPADHTTSVRPDPDLARPYN